jgi:hypothetical protein
LILSLSGAAVESGYVLVAFLTIMNGYLRGRLTDDEGAAGLLTTACETAQQPGYKSAGRLYAGAR